MLYEQGFTISGARNKLDNRGGDHRAGELRGIEHSDDVDVDLADGLDAEPAMAPVDPLALRDELLAILQLLKQGAPQA